jgi:hypothetical protein
MFASSTDSSKLWGHSTEEQFLFTGQGKTQECSCWVAAVLVTGAM